MAVRIFCFSLCLGASCPALLFVGELGWMIESRALTCGMLESLEGTALLRLRVGESCSNLQMHSPSSWLSTDQFHYYADGPGLIEVSYSCNGG